VDGSAHVRRAILGDAGDVEPQIGLASAAVDGLAELVVGLDALVLLRERVDDDRDLVGQHHRRVVHGVVADR
jgi:hypothetical protein